MNTSYKNNIEAVLVNIKYLKNIDRIKNLTLMVRSK